MDEIINNTLLPTRSKRPVGYVVPDPVHEPLYVITTIYNPLRWKSRWKLYERFAKHVADSGAVLYTIEVAFGERDHAVSYAARDGVRAKCDFKSSMIQDHTYIALRTANELWLKENAINYGVSCLPPNWKYVAWIDADVIFSRPNWVGECIHKLQHYKFLQMFSQAQDLGPDYEVIGNRPGFVKVYYDNGFSLPANKQGPYYYYGGRPSSVGWSGLAWACRRDAWDEVGGLLDVCITGAADWYMAFGLVGKVDAVIPKGSHPEFVKAVRQWQYHAEKNVRRNVGYMTGNVSHMWHGKKIDRKYMDRARLLAKLQFNPQTDIRKDWQGLYQLVDHGDQRSLDLRDNIRAWFRQRNEDTIEIE